MKVLLYGPITEDQLEMLDLLHSIEPTSFVTNGSHNPPKWRGQELPVEVIRPTPMIWPEAAINQANWRTVLGADAMVMSEPNEYLVNWVAGCLPEFQIPIVEV